MTKQSQSWGWRAWRSIKRSWEPLRWLRNLAMIAVLIIEATNNNRFLYTFMSIKARTDPMHAFGLNFPWSWADFDATMWAITITMSVLFLSITITRLVGEHQSTKEFWVAVVVALVMSGLSSAGSFILDTTDYTIPDLIGPALSGLIASILGVAVVAFVLFYIRMDTVDEQRKTHALRVEQGMEAFELLRATPAFIHSRLEHKEALALQLAARYNLDAALLLDELRNNKEVVKLPEEVLKPKKVAPARRRVKALPATVRVQQVP